MRRKNANAEGVLFPWEDRAGLRRFLTFGRLGPALSLGLALFVAASVLGREREAAGERRTRVTIERLRGKVERYLLEHDGACPAGLAEVLDDPSPAGSATETPPAALLDGWGRPIRLLCPVEERASGFLLMSDGPDGLPGGLDRIEF